MKVLYIRLITHVWRDVMHLNLQVLYHRSVVWMEALQSFRAVHIPCDHLCHNRQRHGTVDWNWRGCGLHRSDSQPSGFDSHSQYCDTPSLLRLWQLFRCVCLVTWFVSNPLPELSFILQNSVAWLQCQKVQTDTFPASQWAVLENISTYNIQILLGQVRNREHHHNMHMLHLLKCKWE